MSHHWLTTLLPATSPGLGITEEDLWSDVYSALAELCKNVGQQGALVYVSATYDYSEFHLVVNTSSQHAAEAISFTSFDELSAISSGNAIMLPSTSQLTWLDPTNFFGADRAILFARHTIANRLLLIIFISVATLSKASKSLATIRDFVQGPLAVYIDNALFGIELDALTAEASHLMGRAIAKVRTGIYFIDEFVDDLINDKEPVDEQTLAVARRSVHTGLIRLEIIRSNLYSFADQRRGRNEAYTHDYFQTFDVVATIRALMPVFGMEAESHDLRDTHISVKASQALVYGAESALRLTLLNLYDNALKFSYTNTTIDIQLSVTTDRCIISFQNQGIGVASDETQSVFQRLRRSRFRDPQRRTEGMGLGLAYCRRVVEEIFRGTITLASQPIATSSPRRFEGDDWLTTVTIELPLDTSGHKGD